MAFSSIADLNLSEQRLIELTDSAEAPGVEDEAVTTAMHVRATAKVEAALYGKYSLDEDDFPAILTQLEADLWKFYLYQHREVMETPKSVARAYELACEQLEDYRTGREALAAARVNAATEPTASLGSFSSDSDDRVFGRAKDGL